MEKKNERIIELRDYIVDSTEFIVKEILDGHLPHYETLSSTDILCRVGSKVSEMEKHLKTIYELETAFDKKEEKSGD